MRIMRSLSPGGSAPPRQNARPHTRAVLARVAEDQVIPRLLAAMRPAKTTKHCATAPAATPVEQLVGLLLSGTPDQACHYVETLQVCGADSDAAALDLLAHAARRLGEMWEEDLCDFTEVTLGVMRLNAMLRLVDSAFDPVSLPAPGAPRVLLAQAPGEQHGFGLAMVAHAFRRDGWHVRTEAVIGHRQLIDIVGQGWFGVVGISVSCADNVDALASSIAALRSASCNQAIGIMVGGRVFCEQPHLAARVGADSTAADANLAVQQARRLLAKQGQHVPARDR